MSVPLSDYATQNLKDMPVLHCQLVQFLSFDLGSADRFAEQGPIWIAVRTCVSSEASCTSEAGSTSETSESGVSSEPGGAGEASETCEAKQEVLMT